VPRRRSAPEAPAPVVGTVVPPDLAGGPLVGVHGADPLAAWLGYRRAVEAWREREGLTPAEARRLLGGPARAPRFAQTR
jgi:hypothetical protein